MDVTLLKRCGLSDEIVNSFVDFDVKSEGKLAAWMRHSGRPEYMIAVCPFARVAKEQINLALAEIIESSWTRTDEPRVRDTTAALRSCDSDRCFCLGSDIDDGERRSGSHYLILEACIDALYAASCDRKEEISEFAASAVKMCVMLCAHRSVAAEAEARAVFSVIIRKYIDLQTISLR